VHAMTNGKSEFLTGKIKIKNTDLKSDFLVRM